jgi:hypothetical protein
MIKSNSVPNFLFETAKPRKEYTLKFVNNISKIIPYSEFLKITTTEKKK